MVATYACMNILENFCAVLFGDALHEYFRPGVFVYERAVYQQLILDTANEALGLDLVRGDEALGEILDEVFAPVLHWRRTAPISLWIGGSGGSMSMKMEAASRGSKMESSSKSWTKTPGGTGAHHDPSFDS